MVKLKPVLWIVFGAVVGFLANMNFASSRAVGESRGGSVQAQENTFQQGVRRLPGIPNAPGFYAVRDTLSGSCWAVVVASDGSVTPTDGQRACNN